MENDNHRFRVHKFLVASLVFHNPLDTSANRYRSGKRFSQSTPCSNIVVVGWCTAFSTHRLQAVTDSNISSIPYIFAYHLQVAIDSNFTSIIFDSSTITTTSKQLGTLASNTTYYWRIMTLDSGSTSAWTTSHFTTHPILSSNSGFACQWLGESTLVANIVVECTTVCFYESHTGNCACLRFRPERILPSRSILSLFAYHLQVATDSNFSAIIFDSSAITTTSKKLRTLASNTTYYWRLMTLDSGSTSAWTTSYFTTRFIYPQLLFHQLMAQ